MFLKLALHRGKLLLALALLINSIVGFSQVSFTLVSTSVGIEDTTKSYGMYWGDLNNDDFPELYVPNHYNPFSAVIPELELQPSLYMNINGESFNKIVPDILNVKDFHGASFFRTENGPDQKLLMLTGSANKNILYEEPLLNNFQPDTTCAFCPSSGKTRTILALDFNIDGRTDLFVSNEFSSNPNFILSAVYEQQEDYTFLAPNSFNFLHSDFSEQGDIDNDGEMELIVANNGKYRIYNMESGGFNLGYASLYGASDFTIEDFDGDGKFELVVAQAIDPDEIFANDTLVGTYLAYNSGYSELTFTTSDNFDFQVFSYPDGNFSGYAGANYTSFEISGPNQITINDPDYLGYATDTLNENYVNISYSNLMEQWRVQINRNNNASVKVEIHAASGLDLVNFVNIDTNQVSAPIHLVKFEDNGSGIQVLSDDEIFDLPTASLISEDFDNDSDIDLIMYPLNRLNKEPLLFIENDGNELNFSNPVEIIGSAMGRSDVCSSMDYNKDGKMDVGRTSAEGFPGEYALIEINENTTSNTNHWVNIKLQGEFSNADGLGSIVTLSSGGISQKRTFDGGYHRYAQDQAILHFGLGSANQIDNILINWHSGIVQNIGPLTSDTTYTINEINGVGIEEIEVGETLIINPNPSLGIFKIPGVPKSKLSVYSSLGLLILKKEIDKKGDIEIDLSGQNSGTYLLYIQMNNSILKAKLIKL